MLGISSYILSIAGIIVISVIVELVMIEGQMSKYIKSIFAFFVVGVIISPLPSLLTADGLDSVFDFDEYELQSDYINSLNDSKAKVFANELELLLKNEGYENISIQIYYETNEIKLVRIDVSELVVREDAKYKTIKDIQMFIAQTVGDKLKIRKEVIEYENW